MRIGMVCPYSFDVPGGVQSHILQLAEVMRARGHEVSVLAPSSPEADVPLDWPQSCGMLDVGPRKLRTSDGQASDAESLMLRPEAPSLIPSALVADPLPPR